MHQLGLKTNVCCPLNINAVQYIDRESIAVGWENRERRSFQRTHTAEGNLAERFERTPCELTGLRVDTEAKEGYASFPQKLF